MLRFFDESTQEFLVVRISMQVVHLFVLSWRVDEALHLQYSHLMRVDYGLLEHVRRRALRVIQVADCLFR